MGEGAEMMLDGTGNKPKKKSGFLREVGPNSSKTNCPYCNKRVKNSGLNDHVKKVHEDFQ